MSTSQAPPTSRAAHDRLHATVHARVCERTRADGPVRTSTQGPSAAVATAAEAPHTRSSPCSSAAKSPSTDRAPAGSTRVSLPSHWLNELRALYGHPGAEDAVGDSPRPLKGQRTGTSAAGSPRARQPGRVSPDAALVAAAVASRLRQGATPQAGSVAPQRRCGIAFRCLSFRECRQTPSIASTELRQ